MELIEWSTDFEFNIPEMDEQHRSLFSIVNAFYLSLLSGVTQEELKKGWLN